MLKNMQYLISKSLTGPRVSAMRLPKELKDKKKVNSYWSID